MPSYLAHCAKPKLARQRHFRGYTSTKRKQVSDLRRNTLAGASCLYIRRIRTKVSLSD